MNALISTRDVIYTSSVKLFRNAFSDSRLEYLSKRTHVTFIPLASLAHQLLRKQLIELLAFIFLSTLLPKDCLINNVWLRRTRSHPSGIQKPHMWDCI